MALIHETSVPNSYRAAFLEKLVQVSKNLGINPNWLMLVIYWESARSFSPSKKNPYSGATGLIQFMPSTAKGLGTTTAQLAQMTAVEQLDYVEKYYSPYKHKIKSFIDLYFATFYPAAIGKPDNYVLGSSSYLIQKIAEQNPAFDNNKDRKVTKVEVEKTMLEKIPDLWKGEFLKNTMAIGLIGFFMLAGIAASSYYLIYKA
ncbi:transglycosylase-like protein with SLT domain [Mesonia algae]|uniref:Transglycosylase-like protein with SLT domain n=1 Tax=Mesonia algae TaxID=213248 RepID=A0A2W7ISI6_9FLAO|nr:transglycosylase SLT domain-containing protein [Mesonia algae]PZW41623.1 transglycosylase-like protein with SLT domain [Mesonia algae]